MNSLLTVSELKKKYTQGEVEIDVINGQNLELAASEMIAVMGKSGSGKTTFLKMIGDFFPPAADLFLLREKIFIKRTKRNAAGFEEKK